MYIYNYSEYESYFLMNKHTCRFVPRSPLTAFQCCTHTPLPCIALKRMPEDTNLDGVND